MCCVCPGIGRATVKALTEYGAEVVAFSRTEHDLLSLKQEVRKFTLDLVTLFISLL